MATSRDYYDVLGVPRGAPDDEIKRAFRKLAQQWHPDVNKDPSAPERFKEINEAYQVLSDPQQRRAYDMFGRAGVGNGGPEGYGPFGGFGDLFDAFFGAGAGGAQARRARPPAGSDLRYDLRISFEESIRGTEKEIEFSALDRCPTCSGTGAEPGSTSTRCPQCNGLGEIRQVRSTMLGQMVNVTVCPRCHGEGSVVETSCQECHGEGRVQRRRKLRVEIPAGIDEGHQVRLTGEGEAGPRGGPAGNLYVAVHVEEHPALRRDGTELYYDLPLSITQASLGARVTVPTAEGDEAIEVKSGTQPGAEIRLRGRGVPHLRRPGVRGDLHVRVDVRVPTRLSKRQRELLEALAAESGERPTKPGRILDRVKDAIS
ncbi:MAG: molecular chaperone DnaJ [Chloroflexi bacterium]|nr:molecular chaperone DnaJ [Chloroflexota bacterium]